MADAFHDLDIGPRITLGHLLGSDYRIPRIFTRWALDNGYRGLAYASCHDLDSTCWALFEGAKLSPIGDPQQIDPYDNDLCDVARLWRLEIAADQVT